MCGVPEGAIRCLGLCCHWLDNQMLCLCLYKLYRASSASGSNAAGLTHGGGRMLAGKEKRFEFMLRARCQTADCQSHTDPDSMTKLPSLGRVETCHSQVSHIEDQM